VGIGLPNESSVKLPSRSSDTITIEKSCMTSRAYFHWDAFSLPVDTIAPQHVEINRPSMIERDVFSSLRYSESTFQQCNDDRSTPDRVLLESRTNCRIRRRISLRANATRWPATDPAPISPLSTMAFMLSSNEGLGCTEKQRDPGCRPTSIHFEDAFGNYRKLLEDVTLNPSMGLFNLDKMLGSNRVVPGRRSASQ